MRHALLIALAATATATSLGGCASYTQSKIDLAAQARRGVQLARDSAAAREQQLALFDARQRAMLDDAFDSDVYARAALTPDWVVAHRKAYATAIDALRVQRQNAELSRERTLSNLDSVDAAIAQLQRMQQSELKLTIPEAK